MGRSPVVILVALVVAFSGTNGPVVLAREPTVINFFLHDRFLTPVDSSTFVILPALSNTSVFGTMAVFDDSMTVGPEESSLEIGRGRGFYLFDQNSTTTPALEFVFTSEFNEASGYTPGSTLSFKGFDRIREPVREISIVGGTKDFRVARGYAQLETYSLTGIGNAIINFTAYFQYGWC